MGVLLVLGSTVTASGRALFGGLLCVSGFVAFTGALANPKSATLAATATVGIALLVGGRTMEGVGLILLLGAAAIQGRADSTEPG